MRSQQESVQPNVPLQPDFEPHNTSAPPNKQTKKGVFQFTSTHPKLEIFLRIYCTIAAVAMTVTAGYGIGTPEPCLQVYLFMVSIWIMILGIVILLVEWRQRHIRSLFYFLTYKTGRGFFYIFVGCLTTGVAKTAGIIVGFAVIIAGILTLAIALFLKRTKRKAQAQAQAQAQIQTPEHQEQQMQDVV